MRERSGKRSISGLAAALLLCLFAMMILSVLIGGAGAYRRLSARGQEDWDSRNSAQYIATKLRQAPSAESVALCLFGQGDCICISEEADGAEYITRIYCHDGWIMELFAPADVEFAPEDGEKIIRADALQASMEDGLLRIGISRGGENEEIFLALPQGREAAK